MVNRAERRAVVNERRRAAERYENASGTDGRTIGAVLAEFPDYALHERALLRMAAHADADLSWPFDPFIQDRVSITEQYERFLAAQTPATRARRSRRLKRK